VGSGGLKNAISISNPQGGAHVPKQDVSNDDDHEGQQSKSVTDMSVGPNNVCNNSDVHAVA
jgi:hypothetical protein